MERRRRLAPLLARLAPAVVLALLATQPAGCGSAPTPAPAAAFEVSDLTVERAGREIQPGDEVTVTARVRNTGGTTGTYEAELTVDGAVAAQEDTALDAGESSIVRFHVRAGEPGDHDVRLGEDIANLHVVGVAAFEVSDVTVASAGPEVQPGDEVTVTARVRNTGGAAGTYQADLTVDGAVAAQDDVALDAGGSAIVRFQLHAGAPGDHDVRVGEANSTFRVLGPAAFELRSLDVTPNPADTGDRLAISVGVVNSGGLTGTQAVSLLIDGKVAGQEDATLAGGERATLAFSVKAPGPGRHTVTAGDLETQLVVWRIERPANGKILVNKLRGGMGRLTIKNGGDRDAVVILAKSSSPSKTLLAVYLRAGKSSTIRGIKDGTYVVFFGQGERWDGYSKAFTSSQELRRFEDPIRFKTTRTATAIRYSIWTISLLAVVGGNAPSDPVDEGEFPGVP